MGFASSYLEERALFPQRIREAPEKETGIIVVVPAYNEPGIGTMLDSLAECTEPECRVEVIIVINAPDNADAESIENNRKTSDNIESWKTENNNCFFRLFVLLTGESTVRGWGVGLARKTGMDEAVRRFNSLNKPEGVIVSLDADCTVAQNYFLAICNDLLKKSDRSACSICFEHPLSGTNYQESVFKFIALYELHLRYYCQGLAFSGFPYVFHTVGSAIAVKTLPYIKAGGMNRKKAGEDFYFIQKLVPSGGYFNMNATTVYPSPRVSARVPFGTGASMGKLTADKDSTLFTYNIKAFKELRNFFALIEGFFECRPEELHFHYNSLPQSLRLFFNEDEWIEKLIEIKNNSAGIQSFKKRFFGWFNMFRIVKYLNYAHLGCFVKKAVEISASELLELKGIIFESKVPLDLLLYYRKMEKDL